MQKSERFITLDSLRGLSALFVVLFHVLANSPRPHSHFIGNSYIFVEFFFVLSGFVIACSYQKRLSENYSIGKFMLLRFGRVYPLHFAMLIIFVLIEALRYFILTDMVVASPPFSNEKRTVASIFTNLLLIQSFGIEKVGTWNAVSWSISVEFYTYLLFACSIAFLKKNIWILILPLIVLGPLIFMYFNAHIIPPFITCCIGFGTGVMIYNLYQKFQKIKMVLRTHYMWASLLEILVIYMTFCFVSHLVHAKIGYLQSYIFALTVLTFSYESGCVSKFLNHKVFQTLGLLSYSVYLTHIFILHAVQTLWLMIQKILHVHIADKTVINGNSIITLGINAFQENIATLNVLIFVIGFSALTYYYIEKPGRDYFRKWADRIPDKK